jgi:hypothetical protein
VRSVTARTSAPGASVPSPPATRTRPPTPPCPPPGRLAARSSASPVPPEGADRVGSVEVGKTEDVDELGSSGRVRPGERSLRATASSPTDEARSTLGGAANG